MATLTIHLMDYLRKLGITNTYPSLGMKPETMPDGEVIYNLISMLEGVIPVFTTDELLNLLPRWQLDRITGGYEIIVKPDKWDMCLPFPRTTGKTIIQTVYNMVCLLKRKNLL